LSLFYVSLHFPLSSLCPSTRLHILDPVLSINLTYPFRPTVLMSDDGEGDSPPLSFDDGEDNLNLSDHVGEEALSINCNEEISLEDLETAVTQYAKDLNFQVKQPHPNPYIYSTKL
jgi:hypothetical protein